MKARKYGKPTIFERYRLLYRENSAKEIYVRSRVYLRVHRNVIRFIMPTRKRKHLPATISSLLIHAKYMIAQKSGYVDRERKRERETEGRERGEGTG